VPFAFCSAPIIATDMNSGASASSARARGRPHPEYAGWLQHIVVGDDGSEPVQCAQGHTSRYLFETTVKSLSDALTAKSRPKVRLEPNAGYL
jgi:hypothetical protein